MFLNLGSLHFTIVLLVLNKVTLNKNFNTRLVLKKYGFNKKIFYYIIMNEINNEIEFNL